MNKEFEALEWLNYMQDICEEFLRRKELYMQLNFTTNQAIECVKECKSIKQALIKAEKLEKENKFLKAALKTLIKIDDSDLSHLKIKVIPQNVAANQDVIKLLKEMLE